MVLNRPAELDAGACAGCDPALPIHLPRSRARLVVTNSLIPPPLQLAVKQQVPGQRSEFAGYNVPRLQSALGDCALASATQNKMKLRACHCCGLVHEVGPLSEDQEAECIRCFSTLDSGARSGYKSSARCFAAALGGLILYFPAILLPILEIEKLGHHHAASLLGGTIDLIRYGNLLVGFVVLAFSIVLPLVKLLALLDLSYLGLMRRKHRAWTYRLVEWTGRWSMMDVLLLALLVTLVKLGELVSFHIGPAVWAFVMCVIMSMIASIVFDPHAIWEEQLPTSAAGERV